MPKVSDLKAYYRELAVKAGLGEDEIKQVMGAMENEKFAKAFTDGFKPLPDYSHDLDDVRAKTKVEKDLEYQNWYEQEKLVYEKNLAGVKKLEAYEARYGALDTAQQQEFLQNQNRGGNMTKEDIDKLRAEIKAENDAAFARRDKATLDYIEVREKHMNTFKKSLDVKSFEDQWKSHPEWGGDLSLAYEKYVSPEMEKLREAEFTQKAEARYQEGLRDGFSRKVLPSDSQPKSYSPMFDRDVNIEKMSEAEQERHSRSEFFEGLQQKQSA
jgi:hypothetical protein